MNNPIDLQPFCQSEPGRFDLHKPFVQGGYKIATDGRLLVAIATDEHDTTGRLPKNIDTFLDFDRSECVIEPLPLPSNDCKECGGKGEMPFVECEECGGTGEFECMYCGHEEDCKDCRGAGMVPALESDDPSKITMELCKCADDRVEVMPGVGLMRSIAMRLHTIPGVRLSTAKDHKVNFVADNGVIGCFMEMLKESPQ